jgi:serine/threonine protein kinase
VLGTGGYGVVYAAFDRRRSERVALKTLRYPDPSVLVRFKREFRSLAGLSHPNLVSLYDLVSQDGVWFFTMELVEGHDLMARLRPRAQMPDAQINVATATESGSRLSNATMRRQPTPPPDMRELRLVFRQLAEAVDYLHDAGKLHRDLKPSNILVDHSGRAVVLDFGLVSDAAPQQTASNAIIGTPSYMSPEQGKGVPLTAASDWYSFGVVLYQALTGCLPITGGSAIEVLLEKCIRDPVFPSALVDGLPSDLDILCMRLLDRDPRHRAGANEVLAAFESTVSKSSRDAGTRRRSLVGRDDELASLEGALADAQNGRIVTVYVHGESGIGKSALAQGFLDRVRPRALILSARCYERESVPYKALDGVIDALSRHLGRMPPHEFRRVAPPTFAALARIFPALDDAELPLPRSVEWLSPAADPHEARRRAFSALEQLLSTLSEHRPVVMLIDDLQWGDVESGVLLNELIHSRAQMSVLLVLCFRPDADNCPSLAALPVPHADGVPDVRRIALSGLQPADAARLIRELSPARADVADDIVRETDGNPFFIEELVQYGDLWLAPSSTRSYEHVLRERYQRLSREATIMLALVAVAGRPVADSVILAAAGEAGSRKALAMLIAEKLLRPVGESGDYLMVFHDRIREWIMSTLPPDEHRHAHRVLAGALEALGGAAPETLAQHYEGAGDLPAVAHYSALAADGAVAALAFDRAAHLYRRAIDIRANAGTGDDAEREIRPLRVKLAAALANAGHGAAAAEQYLLASDRADLHQRLEWQRCAAEQLLHSGHIDRGLSVLGSVLQAVGLRLPTPFGRVPFELLWRRALVRMHGVRWRRRAAADLPEDALLRIDACSSAATGLALVDIARGSVLQSQNLLLAMHAGEPSRIAKALAMEAGYQSTSGPRGQRRSRRLIRLARQLSEQIDDPEALGRTLVMAAGSAWNAGRWIESRDYARQAIALLLQRGQGLMWERDTANIFHVESLRWSGAWREMKESVGGVLTDAQQRGDLYVEAIVRMHCGSCVLLADDRPDEARAGLSILQRWSTEGFHVEHLVETHNQVEIALYQGNAGRAAAVIEERWPALASSLLLRVEALRIQMRSLRARAALAAAFDSSGGARAKWARIAAEQQRALHREPAFWAKPLVLLIDASAAALDGGVERAATLLDQAESAARAADMTLHAAAASRARGVLLAGDNGRALIAQADAAMAVEGIVAPSRLASVFVPAIRA